jgi:hypothetical protein
MIAPQETVLEGKWLAEGSKVVADDTARRIDALLKEQLKKVATSSDGWSQLYLDPTDGRLWQRTFPHSEMHGGGSQKLEVISIESAKELYSYEV